MIAKIKMNMFAAAVVSSTLMSGCATTTNHPAPVTEGSPRLNIVSPPAAIVPAEIRPAPAKPSESHHATDPDTGERQPLLELPRGVKRIQKGFSISLASQRACFFRNGAPLRCAPISSGMTGYRTVTGDFWVISKSPMALSYKYPNAAGEPAKMPWSICFYGDYCIHAGHLPGHPASHGCVRTHERDALQFYKLAQIGDPVVIY